MRLLTARPRGRLPGGADLLRADALNTGYHARRCRWCATFVAAFEGYDAVVAPSGSCVGSVRHQHAMVARALGRRGPGASRAERSPRAPTSCPSSWSTCSASTDVGAYYPHRVTYHPTCHSLRMLRRRRPAAAAAARRARHRPGRAAEAEECCGFGGTFAVKNAETSVGDARRQDAPRASTPAPRCCIAGDSSCLMHIGGVLSRQRAGVRTVHLAEILAVDRRRPADVPASGCRRRATRVGTCADAAVPRAAARRGAGRRPAAAQPRPRHRHHPRQARRRRRRGRRLGGSCASARPAIKDDTLARLAEHLLHARGARSPPAAATVHWAARRRRGQRDRHRPGRRRTGADEVVKVKSMATQEIGLNEALAAQGIAAVGDRPRRADRPARRRHALPHPGAGDPPQPRRDPRHLPREMPGRSPAPEA